MTKRLAYQTSDSEHLVKLYEDTKAGELTLRVERPLYDGEYELVRETVVRYRLETADLDRPA